MCVVVPCVRSVTRQPAPSAVREKYGDEAESGSSSSEEEDEQAEVSCVAIDSRIVGRLVLLSMV